jgi:hypothetical protein
MFLTEAKTGMLQEYCINNMRLGCITTIDQLIPSSVQFKMAEWVNHPVNLTPVPTIDFCRSGRIFNV